MAKPKYPNTVIKYEMLDGEVEMTLQMFALYQVRAKSKAVWEKYNKITTGKGEDGELDIAFVLYVAYMCRCVNAGIDDRYGSFENFLMNLPPDDDAMEAAYIAMRHPKKA